MRRPRVVHVAATAAVVALVVPGGWWLTRPDPGTTPAASSSPADPSPAHDEHEGEDDHEGHDEHEGHDHPEDVVPAMEPGQLEVRLTTLTTPLSASAAAAAVPRALAKFVTVDGGSPTTLVLAEHSPTAAAAELQGALEAAGEPVRRGHVRWSAGAVAAPIQFDSPFLEAAQGQMIAASPSAVKALNELAPGAWRVQVDGQGRLVIAVELQRAWPAAMTQSLREVLAAETGTPAGQVEFTAGLVATGRAMEGPDS